MAAGSLGPDDLLLRQAGPANPMFHYLYAFQIIVSLTRVYQLPAEIAVDPAARILSWSSTFAIASVSCLQ